MQLTATALTKAVLIGEELAGWAARREEKIQPRAHQPPHGGMLGKARCRRKLPLVIKRRYPSHHEVPTLRASGGILPTDMP